MNLFTMLSALGLSHTIYGERLLPVGTLYDPFIERGLDALNYACYQDARFILVATPSGVTLAGGGRRAPVDHDAADRHGAGRADQLRAGLRGRARPLILRWAFEHMQRPAGDGPDAGGSVYLRLSTRSLDQPQRELAAPTGGCDRRRLLAAAPRPECRGGDRLYRRRRPGGGRGGGPDRGGPARRGLLAVTSADRLHAAGPLRNGRAEAASRRASHVERLLAACRALRPGHGAGRPPGDAGLARLGARPPHPGARRHAFRPDRHDRRPLPRAGIDAQAIVAAAQAVAPGRPMRYLRAVSKRVRTPAGCRAGACGRTPCASRPGAAIPAPARRTPP